MKILLLGNGAREHAIGEALRASQKKPEIVAFMSANNPGIARLASKVKIVDSLMNFAALKEFARAEKPDFAVLGPDDPICAGAGDALAELGIRSVAPLKKNAQLEGSKSFTRELLAKYHIVASPDFQTFTTEEGMADFAERNDEIVVKADGLCGGKGVQVQGDHFTTAREGLAYAKECLARDGKVVLEEKLIGQEFSLLFFVDGQTLIPMPVVQDNKRAFEDDRGPNTGGMGTVSDADHLLPFVTQDDLDQATVISQKVIEAVQKENKETFRGILFGGFMVTRRGVKLIEYNTRFGDPEAMNILSVLETDFVDICEAILNTSLKDLDIKFAPKATVCKYVVPEGYPDHPTKNVAINFDESKLPENVKVFYASVDAQNTELILQGSRAIAFVGIADNMFAAEKLAETAATLVSGPVFHRADIGTEALMNKRKNTIDW